MKNAVINHPRLLAVLVLLAAVVIIRLTVPTYVIGSGSMEPTLPVRTIIFYQPATQLQPRDVIIFQKEGDDRPTTHTFIGYDEQGNVLTKGDANPTPDVHTPPLTMADVKGKVTYALTPQRTLGLLLACVLIVMFVIPANLRREDEQGEPTSDPEDGTDAEPDTESDTQSEQSNPTDTPRVTTPA